MQYLYMSLFAALAVAAWVFSVQMRKHIVPSPVLSHPVLSHVPCAKSFRPEHSSAAVPVRSPS